MNYFPSGYPVQLSNTASGYFPPPTIQPQQVKVQNVNGIEGAKAYPLAGDSSVLLLDSNNPIVWLVQTDSAGYKTCTPYDIIPHKETPAPTPDDFKALSERISKIEERLNANESNLRYVSKEQS